MRISPWTLAGGPDPPATAGAGIQATRCLLLLYCTHAEPRQFVECKCDRGLRAGQDVVGKVSSRKAEGIDEYKIDFARDKDAFPPVQWPKRTFDELLEVTFRNANIDHDKHPGLLRLIGAKPDLT